MSTMRDLFEARARTDGTVLPPLGDWKPFTYDQLFKIARGLFVPSAEQREGTTAYVRATEDNNGVTGYADLPASHPGGVITVARNGSVGEAFYQPDPFFASDDVHIFYPKTEITEATALFLCAMIRAEKYRFGYGRKWSVDRMKRSIMRLPVGATGKPDWALMASFVMTLRYSKMILEEHVAAPPHPPVSAASR